MADTKMQLVDWLDDLCVRFIINLPKEELESVERICFQIEEAHWFYEDFIRPLDPSLPSMNLKHFCLLIFQHCPLFSEYAESYYSAAYSEFLAYKTRVPVRGAILLNDAMDHVVLVKGWKKGARWSFPRGKINKDEDDLDCAVREVYEETGFDARAAGLVKDESQMKYIEVSMREQHMRLYVFRGVPMDTYFEPRTRKEISKISWYKISELPTLKKKQQQGGENLYKENMFYMVAPFLGPLKNWIKQQHKLARRAAQAVQVTTETAAEEETAADESAVEGPTKHRVSPDSHLQSLIAGLRQSKVEPDTTNLPEVTSAPEPVPDPASALKRLLSVSGQGGMPPQQPSSTSSNPLLALLKGGQPQQMPLSQSSSIPVTPFEQINSAPGQPPTPQHQQRRPPQFANMGPPPQFPYSPAHQGVHQQLPVPQSGNGYFSGAPMNIPPPPVPNFRPQLQSQQSVASWHSQPAPYPQQDNFPRPGFQPQPPAPSRPYQRTGDPEFAQGTPSSAPHGSMIPSASKLPAPKLNAHTLNLLNAFKSGPPARQQETSPQPAMKPFTAAAEIYSSCRPQDHISTPQIPEMAQGRSNGQAQSNNYVDGQPPPVGLSTKPRNAQANTLLGLFRKPSEPGPGSPPQEMPAQSLAPEPAELSAQSPSIDRQQLAQSTCSGQTSAEPVVPPVDITNHNRAGGTSATVSGPFNAPDFDQLRKHTKFSQENGRSSPRTQGRPKSRPDQQATPQFSILARSRHEAVATPSPKHAAAAPAQRRNTNSPRNVVEAPKPFAPHFTPQILRRPQNAVSPSPSRAPSHSLDRRESASSDQKTALLSLFNNKPQTQSPKTFPSGIISPVSPLPEKQFGSHDDRSRISSIASVPGEGLAPRSSRSSLSGQPTTPVDKSFLLGYLNGIVKDAGK
ncbi:hypothetical protein MPH_07091 [Macrophomina phaseolina MS6]|uniref:Nudix hydrolase domain-containing protein n=1 Tax=Macrophomina phaseolina (strain MS6) TaxID=1126212 RepID=K2R076_MACPH|nr:hypothetical protein MPH_07091 [Macrophomina phaseolina MS6]